MQGQENIVVGLDIGTTKICAVVGEVSNGKINIIGTGTHPSIGLRKGVVVNIESTVESIKKAVEEAELMAGCEISSVPKCDWSIASSSCAGASALRPNNASNPRPKRLSLDTMQHLLA